MARISGVDLPRDKRIEVGLTYVYGIGLTSARKILAETGINPDTRVKDLTDEEEAKLRECIDKSYIVFRCAGHQASDRDRLLSRHPSQKRSARTRTEEQDECPYPQGPEAYDRK